MLQTLEAVLWGSRQNVGFHSVQLSSVQFRRDSPSHPCCKHVLSISNQFGGRDWDSPLLQEVLIVAVSYLCTCSLSEYCSQGGSANGEKGRLHVCSEHKDSEGKDNKAFVIFNLCNANVGWLALVVPALIISFLAWVSLFNTSNFCPPNFGKTVLLGC